MSSGAAERPVTKRRGARVLLLADDQVLLQGDRDPGVPGSAFWQLPGGGIDEGETAAQAAVREVWEETGLQITQEDLLGPIATRTVVHGYSDRVLIQEEVFFLVRCQRFSPQPKGLTEREAQRFVEIAWHDLAALPEPTWAPPIVQLATWSGAEPMNYGWVDESTVKV